VRSYGSLAGVAVAPAFPLAVRRLWQHHRYDIAHLHFPDPLSLFAAELLPRAVKRVITWHSDVVRQHHLLALYQPFVDRLLRRADAVVAATPRHFENSRQLGAVRGSDKCRVIPYGIEAAPFAGSAAVLERAAQIRAALPEPGFVVFAIGRHVYYKGFEFLLRAMRELEGTLVLGGTGPLLEEHRRLAAQAGIAGRVVFPERIEQRDLGAYYHAADAFCLPSCEQSEAFGIVQLEAMAAGRPIVNCDLGNGVNHVAPPDACALTVPARDPAALAHALARLRADPALRGRLGAEGRRRVAETFSIEAMVRQHLALYRELLEARSAR